EDVDPNVDAEQAAEGQRPAHRITEHRMDVPGVRALHGQQSDLIIGAPQTQLLGRSRAEDTMAREIVFRAKKFQVALDTTPMPDGRVVPRHLILHPGAVAILPVLDADHVCLLRNFRPAAGEELWEIPAGTLEPGESPDAAAIRELAEETGYRAA